MFKPIRKLIDLLPPLGRSLRDIRDWRARAILKPIESTFGFRFWGGNYLASGVHEPAELSLIANELRSADVLVDCGANAGLFTCLAAARGVPAIAVEPSAFNLSVLYRNLRENKFTSPIEVYPLALGAQPGIAPLYGRGQGASLVAGWGGTPTFDSNLVSVLPLDAIMGQRFDGKRVILKIDVEGGEWDLLQGASTVLRARPRVLMELSLTTNQPNGRHPHFQEILDLFWRMNYRITPARSPEDQIKPSLVDKWLVDGKTDLPGENIWLTPA